MKKFTLKSLLLAAAALTAGSAMAQQPASVVFAMNDTDNPTAYVATEGAFSGATLELAEGLAFNGAKKIWAPDGTGHAYETEILALKVSNNSAAATDLVTWTVQPAEGLVFTPTHVKGYINRDGTDQEKTFTISVKKADGEAIALGTYTAWRQNKDSLQKPYDAEAVYFYDIELTAEQQAALASSEGFVLMSTIGVPSSRSAFFGEVTIEGTVEAASTGGEGEGEEPETPETPEEPETGSGTDIEPTFDSEKDIDIEGVSYTLAATFNAGKGTRRGTQPRNGVKLRTQNADATWKFEVKESYTITSMVFDAYANCVAADDTKAPISIIKIEVDGEEVEFEGGDLVDKNSGSGTISVTGIHATQSVVFYFDNSNVDGNTQVNTTYEITWEQGGTTGIETVEAQAATGISYDLMGRRASDKGLMIRDGKVILVK